MATDYSEKIAKCEEAIAKKNTLIAKREASIAKMNKTAAPKLKKLGIEPAKDNTIEEYRRVNRDFDTARAKNGNWENTDLYGVFDSLYWGEMYKIGDAFESIDNARGAIAEKMQTIEGYKAKQDKALDLIKQIEAMPESIREFKERVEASWNAFDIRLRDKLNNEAYPEFVKKYDALCEAYDKACWENKDKKKAYEEREAYVEAFNKEWGYAKTLSHLTDEQIRANNLNEAMRLIIDLYARVTRVTGEITDADRLIVTSGNQGYAVINGLVVGKEGRAEVESIECGGYNIVRWHIRTIIKDRP